MATRLTDQPLSLKAAYAAAERQREALERGVLPAGATDPAAAAASALAAYEHCAARAIALALFSPNESADDIATAHLPYLLLPFRIAELVQRLPATQPGDQRGGGGGPFGGFDPAVRRGLLRRARDAYERFLHQLDTYGLLTPPYVRLLRAYAASPATFSTVDADATALAGGGGTDPAARRAAKIANLQAEQALRGRLEAQRQRQAAARAHYRRRRWQAATDNDEDEENGTRDAPQGNDRDNNEGEDDDDDDDDDSEEARALYLAELAHGAHLAFQGLEGLNREDALLAQAPPPDARRGTATTMGGLGDGRQRQSGGGGVADNGYSDRLDNVGRGAAVGGPLLTADGKPRQPFTIVGRRADLAKAVFRPGHNLPTMSIDEYLAEERRRGNVIEGGGPSSGQAPEPVDEDDMDKADAETMKARAWDEFTEANPRGAGNTLNRG